MMDIIIPFSEAGRSCFDDDAMICSLFFCFFYQAIDSQTRDSLSQKFSYDPPLYGKMIQFPRANHRVNFTIEVCGKNQKISILVKDFLVKLSWILENAHGG